MTKEDAIFFLNELRRNNNCDETIDMAIAALREPARKPCGWCNDGVMQIVDSPNKPPIRSNYCGLCGRKLRDCPENCAEGGTDD